MPQRPLLVAGWPWQGGLAEQRAIRQKTVPALQEATCDGSSDVPQQGHSDVPRGRSGHISPFILRSGASPEGPPRAARRLCHPGRGHQHSERLRGISRCSVAAPCCSPGKSLVARNSFELFFAVKNKNAAPLRRGGFPGEETCGCIAA